MTCCRPILKTPIQNDRTARYSIALSKLDRGADTDYDDLVFLAQNHYIGMDEFERMVMDALPQANKFDFNPDILEHLQELKNRLK